MPPGWHARPEFDTAPYQVSYLPLGSSVSHVVERIHEASTTEEAAEALIELTAAHDGILAALDGILTATATADFHDGPARQPTLTSRGGSTSPTSICASSAPTSPTPATRSPAGTNHTPAAASAPEKSPPQNASAPPCAPARPRRVRYRLRRPPVAAGLHR